MKAVLTKVVAYQVQIEGKELPGLYVEELNRDGILFLAERDGNGRLVLSDDDPPSSFNRAFAEVFRAEKPHICTVLRISPHLIATPATSSGSTET
jgi:hypothetical protein